MVMMAVAHYDDQTVELAMHHTSMFMLYVTSSSFSSQHPRQNSEILFKDTRPTKQPT